MWPEHVASNGIFPSPQLSVYSSIVQNHQPIRQICRRLSSVNNPRLLICLRQKAFIVSLLILQVKTPDLKAADVIYFLLIVREISVLAVINWTRKLVEWECWRELEAKRSSNMARAGGIAGNHNGMAVEMAVIAVGMGPAVEMILVFLYPIFSHNTWLKIKFTALSFWIVFFVSSAKWAKEMNMCHALHFSIPGS